MSDWRIAGGVMDEKVEFLAAREADPSGYDVEESYDPADDAERWNAPPDPYTGTCGGCGRHVSTRSEGGSCLWRGGAWHPACRERDKAAGEQAQGVIVF